MMARWDGWIDGWMDVLARRARSHASLSPAGRHVTSGASRADGGKQIGMLHLIPVGLALAAGHLNCLRE